MLKKEKPKTKYNYKLTVQVIFALQGPSTASPKLPTPAPLVSTENFPGLSTNPFSKPGPKAFTLDGSQPSVIAIEKGDPGTGISL